MPAVDSEEAAPKLNSISVKPAKFRRKKNSWFVPIFVLVLCLGGIGGLAYIVINLDAIRGSGATGENPAKVKPIARPIDATSASIDDVPEVKEDRSDRDGSGRVAG